MKRYFFALLIALNMTAVAAIPPALGHHPVTTSSGFTAFFFDGDAEGETHNTWRTSVAVDSQGGMHLAYTLATGSEPRPAVYAYCPSSCHLPTNWTRTAVGFAVEAGTYASISWAKLELDQSVEPNRPRLLMAAITPALSYAACDANCTNGANWTITPLVDSAYTDDNISFALDTQGRPHLVYNDDYDETFQSAATLYAACNGSCTEAGNWYQVGLATDRLERPSLALTPAGGVRLVDYFGGTLSNPTTELEYWECNGACHDPSQWAYVSLFKIGSTSTSFALRLDSQGRPRLALFPGTNLEETGSDFSQKTLYYLWCNADCLQAGNWQYTQVLNPPAEADYFGSEPDLALDAQDRPHVVYNASNGVGYARCTANCETASGAWTATTIETQDELNQSHPIEPVSDQCQQYPTWSMGARQSLALDGQGQAWVSYDAAHISLCNDFTIRTNLQWARLALSTSQDPPQQPEPERLFVPLITR